MKSKNWRKYIFLGGVLFLFPLIWVLFFGVMGKHHFNTLPYFDVAHPAGDTVVSNHVVHFDGLFDENGKSISSDSLKGKVWLACFYDLKDPNIAKITERLLNVNFKYRDEPDIKIVVFASRANMDSLETIQQYLKGITKYNGFSDKWKFLVEKDSSIVIPRLMQNGFFINDISQEARFRLVDTKGHIRGLYGNTEYHMQSIIEDIALLKKEVDVARYQERHAKENH
jgi:cytochrome oxidase Cu insertion factor (SCO1/SenC/PrrC family)